MAPGEIPGQAWRAGCGSVILAWLLLIVDLNVVGSASGHYPVVLRQGYSGEIPENGEFPGHALIMMAEREGDPGTAVREANGRR